MGHEQVIGAFQRGGVFAFCSKVAGVKNEGAPLILKAVHEWVYFVIFIVLVYR